MIYIITGHRLEKLSNYDIDWIKLAITDILEKDKNKISLAYSGMASGVDLWFCEACYELDIPYIACVPFEDQDKRMNKESVELRQHLISKAKGVKTSRNSFMVEKANVGIVVWDGNKGGTHNVLQQLVEKKIDFYWVNPVKEIAWECFG